MTVLLRKQFVATPGTKEVQTITPTLAGTAATGTVTITAPGEDEKEIPTTSASDVKSVNSGYSLKHMASTCMECNRENDHCCIYAKANGEKEDITGRCGTQGLYF